MLSLRDVSSNGLSLATIILHSANEFVLTFVLSFSFVNSTCTEAALRRSGILCCATKLDSSLAEFFFNEANFDGLTYNSSST